MTANSTPVRPASGIMRDHAVALIAAGNSVEAVAGVFGMPADRLRSLLEQPADMPSIEVTPALPVQPWHRFPGTVVYRCPNYAAFFLLVPVLSAALWLGHQLVAPPQHRPFFVVACVLVAVACVVGIVVAWQAARVARFEMRRDAVARYTLAGCTVVPYVDIIAMIKAPAGEGFQLQLLTRHGLALTIVTRRAHMQDARLAAWVKSIPDSGREPILSTSDKVSIRFSYGLLICQVALLIVTLGTGVHDTYKSNLATTWPTTDGVVTESGSEPPGSGRNCHQYLHLHYAYTVADHPYLGDTYRFGGECGRQTPSIAARNPVGKHLLVYYRPTDPSDSVIVPGPRSYTVSFVFILLTLALFCLFWRNFIRDRGQNPGQA